MINSARSYLYDCEVVIDSIDLESDLYDSHRKIYENVMLSELVREVLNPAGGLVEFISDRFYILSS